MNNKGQSLVMFIIIIPILLLVLGLVLDLGNIIFTKNHLDNTNYLVIDYALDNLNDNDNDIKNKMLDLLNKNNKGNITTTIKIENNKIYITTEKDYEEIFLNIKIKTIKSSYIGYIENNNKIIERV